jgi:hypothetical protein
MVRWQGYLPEASASLLSTFNRASRRGVQFSLAERALFMACEFWTAISERNLAAHLGADSIDALRYMSIIYSSIGAQAVVSAMGAAIVEIEGTAHQLTRNKCLAALQERLLKTQDPVDQLIARMAVKLGLGSRGSLSGGLNRVFAPQLIPIPSLT